MERRGPVEIGGAMQLRRGTKRYGSFRLDEAWQLTIGPVRFGTVTLRWVRFDKAATVSTGAV